LRGAAKRASGTKLRGRHARDFDAPIDYAIEERVRMNQYGSQSWHDLIARAPHQRLFGKTLTRPVEFAQETVCDFC
jgi:hypothetical protein